MLIKCKLSLRFGLSNFIIFSNDVTITRETIKIVSDIAKIHY